MHNMIVVKSFNKKTVLTVTGIILAALLLIAASVYAVQKIQEMRGRAAGDESPWSNIYSFQTTSNFRAHLTTLNDKLLLFAKDRNIPSDKDNTGGQIDIYTYDGTNNWTTSVLPGCLTKENVNIDTGNFSDIASINGRLYWGTYPRTALMSYDGQTCRALFSYKWGNSIWQTASYPVLYGYDIYFVANNLHKDQSGENVESSTLISFNASDPGYPTMNKYSGSFKVSDGRDPSQGPLVIFNNQLYFNQGTFRAGGVLGVSNGGFPYDVASSPSYNFYTAAADENRKFMILAGWNEASRTTGIFKYDGSTFTSLKEIPNSRFRPQSIAIFQDKIYVGGSEPNENPITVFTIDSNNNITYQGTEGNSGYEVMDFQVYNGNLYALAKNRSSLGSGEVWILGESTQGGDQESGDQTPPADGDSDQTPPDDGGQDNPPPDNSGTPPTIVPIGDNWNEFYKFNEVQTARSIMAIQNDKLLVIAKDQNTAEKDDNKGGKFNTFTYNGSTWQSGAFPICKTKNGQGIAIGNLSDAINVSEKLYFGTYPTTGFMRYDGENCNVIHTYPWGTSIWQTASRGVLYKDEIYFVANKLQGGQIPEGKTAQETHTLMKFNPTSSTFPALKSITSRYQVSDGREPTQGPLAVFKGKLYFTNGMLQKGGYLGVSEGGAPTMVPDSKDYNFYTGIADETRGKLYLGGWNELFKETGICSFDGTNFTEILKLSAGLMRPRSMIIHKDKLFVSGFNFKDKPILVFNLDSNGNATYVGTQGKENFEVTDMEVYKGTLFVLAHKKTSGGRGTTDAEIWAWDLKTIQD